MEDEPKTFEEIINSIKKQAVIHLATFDGDFPRVRPLTMVTYDSRHFVLTGTNDAKIKQLRQNDLVEACYDVKGEKGNGYIRMDGKMEIIDDMDTKRDVAEKTDYFKEYWSTPEDSTYALLEFHIENIEYMKPGDIYAKKFSK